MSAATYSFKAVDASGTPEKGEISGVSREAVTAELKSRGLTVMDLVEKKTGLSMDISLGGKKVKAQELTVMTRQLATMISSGMTLLRTFYVLEEQVENQMLRETISAVREGRITMATAESRSSEPSELRKLVEAGMLPEAA